MSPRSLPPLAFALLLYAGCDTAEPVAAGSGTASAGSPKATATPRPDTPQQPASTGGPPARRTNLRIGTWNLEHFGQRDKFQDQPDSPPNRTPQQVQGIADFLADLQIDVLAVQEVGGPEPLHDLARRLGRSFSFCLGTTGVYGDTRISVGFLFDTRRVELVQCEELADFPGKVGELAVFHRKPVCAVFRAITGAGKGMDFRAITVHLKASRGAKNEAKRTAEVKVLRDYIAGLQASAGEDQDIVVLGDFNHTYGAPAHQAFTAGDFVRYLDAPRDPSGTPSPTIVWFDDPIDHIALTPGIRDEVVPGSYRRHNLRGGYTPAARGQVTDVERRWRVDFSDHFPVSVELRAEVDLDPDSTFRPPRKALPVLGGK